MYLLAKKKSISLLDKCCFGGMVCARVLPRRTLLSHPSTAINTAWCMAVLVQCRVEAFTLGAH